MTDILDNARAALEGVTPGPWVLDDHADEDYPTITVGSGSYLKDPGNYFTTDLVHEVDTYSDELDDLGYNQKLTDARFIAQARELVPELLAEVEALRSKVAEIRATVEYWVSNDPTDPRLPQALRQGGQTILAVLDAETAK